MMYIRDTKIKDANNSNAPKTHELCDVGIDSTNDMDV